MADLKFDIAEMTEMKSKCEKLIDDPDHPSQSLNGLTKTLNDRLEKLKTDWNTDAGDKFFSELNTEWTKQVAEYTKAIEAVIEFLDKAISEFSAVEEQAKALSFKEQS